MSVDVRRPPYIKARDYNKGRIKPIELIVIHSMEAPEREQTAENVARYFQHPDRVGSAHYCVDNQSLVQCVWDRDTAWHCRNANANGIGIELAGYARQTEQEWLDSYGRAMLDIAARLAAYLCGKFKIPVQRAVFAGPDDPKVIERGFCGHVDVPKHGSHTDPGVGFPWAHYLDLVRYYYNA